MSNDEDLSPGQMMYFISLANEGNPDVHGSRELLRMFCRRARELKFPDSPIPPELALFVARAFERYLNEIERAEGRAKPNLERLLGLKRVGKPPDPEIEKRNHHIAADVVRIKMTSKPLVGNRSDDGAFAKVAKKYKLSADQVRDIFYEFENEGLAIVLIARLLERDDSG